MTRVPTARIRRWIRGYQYSTRVGDKRSSPPVVHSQIDPIDGHVAIGFLDLIETRFVDAFRSAGVSWRSLRLAHERACELIGSSHPFSTEMFRSDGRHIFADITSETGEPILLNLASNEFAFKRILAPYLYDGLEFADQQAARWWPMGTRRRVVIDPARSFGQPIVAREGLPTAVLANAYRVEKSVEAVARWYDVEKRSVRDAVEFEQRLAA